MASGRRHRRFQRWCHAGIWERVFETLTSYRDNQYLMIDSTIVRDHQQAAIGKGRKNQALGRYRGGLITQEPCWPMRSAGDFASLSPQDKPVI